LSPFPVFLSLHCFLVPPYGALAEPTEKGTCTSPADSPNAALTQRHLWQSREGWQTGTGAAAQPRRNGNFY